MNINQLGVALYTIVHKEVRRFMRIWPQTLLPPAITMSLYFVIFGNLVGSRIGEMGGYSYMGLCIGWCNSRSVCCHYCQCHEPVFCRPLYY